MIGTYTILKQTGDPDRDDPGFSTARTRQHKHRTTGMQDGLLLLGIEVRNQGMIGIHNTLPDELGLNFKQGSGPMTSLDFRRFSPRTKGPLKTSLPLTHVMVDLPATLVFYAPTFLEVGL